MGLLEKRLGRVHARQRLGIERDHAAQVFGQGLNFFHPENVPAARAAIAAVLTCCGLYGRGLANARKIGIVENPIDSPRLPAAFDGYAVLHLSDLHVDMSDAITDAVISAIARCDYDLCAITGDIRALTVGSHAAAMAGMARIRAALHKPVFAVLGNHDSISMLPELEGLDIRVLMNECETISRGDVELSIVGVDDAHYFRMDNVEKAAAQLAEDSFSILLSHTPEIYRQAAHAGFDVMLAGHTHGGQVCLPGGFPLTLDSTMPRKYGAGAWKHAGLQGYTSRGAGCSIIPVRFNCPPEITIHRLRRR